MNRVFLSWSSGKDSAYALHVLNESANYEVVGLLTTVTEEFGRVSMHGVREELLDLQAEQTGLPMVKARLPWPCSNEIYAEKMSAALEQVKAFDVDTVAFGDLFLEDVRAYREAQMERVGMACVFPLWGRSTGELAGEMIGSGVRAILACVDSNQLDAGCVGREYDERLLEELPEHVDPCGENGEFHTFVYDGPMFRQAIPVARGDVVDRDGFVFADILPLTGESSDRPGDR